MTIPTCPDCGGPQYQINGQDRCQTCGSARDFQDFRLRQGAYATKPAVTESKARKAKERQ